MTISAIFDPGQPVIISTADSPLREELDQLERSIRAYRGGKCSFQPDRFDLNRVFFDGTDPSDKKRFDDMIASLLHANLAIIDLSLGDRSHYVLGLRHALSNSPTLCLSKGEATVRVANSRFTRERRRYIDTSQAGWLQQVESCYGLIDRQLERGWENDVHASELYRINPSEKPYKQFRIWRANTDGKGKRTPEIVIFQGNVVDAKIFDIWVNSENVRMEMARFWDRSVSARIRWLGSVPIGSPSSGRRKDALGLALAEQMGTRTKVEVGKVFLTMTDPASALNADNCVECVAHVASTIPNDEVYGFDSGGKIRTCLENVFREVAKFAKKNRGRQKLRLESILIPLIGSGDGGSHPALVAHQIVAALDQLCNDPDLRKELDLDKIKTIGLLAYFPSHARYLKRELVSYGFAATEGGD